VPAAFRTFPGVDLIDVTDRVEDECDALFVMECGDLTRPGIAGLERHRAINIDHHLGNTAYGAVNWFDGTAAACGEMVVDVVDAIAFDRGDLVDTIREGDRVDVAGRLASRRFGGFETLQLVVLDVAPARDAVAAVGPAGGATPGQGGAPAGTAGDA